ncbi:MAG: two component transcriptional regulator, LuxR family [Thermoleophilia bacterium]|nr:two component transcriptional regulator, LuxR family [Thermoleophilia bacterium]
MTTCIIVHPLQHVRDGLRVHLDRTGIARPLLTAERSGDAVEAIEAHSPGFVIIGLDREALDALAELDRRDIDVPVVGYSHLADPFLVPPTALAGARAYVLKGSNYEPLGRAIVHVLGGRRDIDADVAFALFDSVDAVLTTREREVLQHASHGLSNKLIAHEMAIGTETVRSHMASVIGKLNGGNRTGAVAKALRMTLID